MDQQTPQGFWTTMIGQRCVMDTSCARNPTVVFSGPHDHLGPPPPPPPPPPHLPLPRPSDTLLDGEKTGATLLFSGVFLTLVGITFTTMGWQHYQDSHNFEWPQLLGPILISVGCTFVLTSICKFGIISCWRSRQWDEDVLVMPVMEQTSAAGHPFTLSGINHPIMLRGGTTMLCIPPPYNFITQETSQAGDFQPGALPPLDAACCADNAAFTAEEADLRGNR